ncbi:MAG: Asp-tRNA(Asn)/Glu-tRNA(Gln) amidotransferase subunit GatC, partial [Propionibacteriaceae bacterium]|nr:Asp-tRNA(Asn)/Glu-tRNA(Gln) amidotransferase subunit GatC [Propionibacteriaceae bacterium]
MGVTTADVARLAGLARLELTQDELAALAPQLDVILDAVKSVGHVADQDIPPTSHAVPLVNVMRADEVHESFPPQAMLAGA